MRSPHRFLPVLALFGASIAPFVGVAHAASKDEAAIEALNQRQTDATLKMDNAATLALWAKNGVSLLPGTAPLVGKERIRNFLEEITVKYAGWKVLTQEDACHDLHVAGNLATEWCDTRQVIRAPGGKTTESLGRMLLVLIRSEDGSWRIQEEMWQSAR